METAGRRVSPDHLSRKSRDFWLAIERAYVLEPAHIQCLTLASEALDRARQAREILDAEGLMIEDRFSQKKPHPMIKVEKDAWSAFRLLLRELGLDFQDAEPPRSPRLGG